MKPKELAVQSFHENQNLLSAVNTLSIHTKLEMAGHSDLNTEKDIRKAKEDLCAFLKELNPQVQRVEIENKPLLGVDPRRRQFVRHLIAAKQNYRIRSPFLLGKLSEGSQLLDSKEGDKAALLLFLEELRMLLEEHIGSDVQQLFGGF